MLTIPLRIRRFLGVHLTPAPITWCVLPRAPLGINYIGYSYDWIPGYVCLDDVDHFGNQIFRAPASKTYCQLAAGHQARSRAQDKIDRRY